MNGDATAGMTEPNIEQPIGRLDPLPPENRTQECHIVPPP